MVTMTFTVRGAVTLFVLPAALLLGVASPAGATDVEYDGDSSVVSLSDDGRIAAYQSGPPLWANPPVQSVWVRDIACAVTESPGARTFVPFSSDVSPLLSPDGRYVAFTRTDPMYPDNLLIHDRVLGTFPPGVPGRDAAATSFSADGRYLGFTGGGVLDRRTGTIDELAVGVAGAGPNDWVGGPRLSADGRFGVFVSFASNLVAGDTNGRPDVFVRDRWARTTRLVSAGLGGRPSAGEVTEAWVDRGGRFVTFTSGGADLVPGDTNGRPDVFVRDLWTGAVSRVSVGAGGQADGGSGGGAISADGRLVAFWSDAADLVPGDTNGVVDVFVHDRWRGTTRRVSVGPGGRQLDRASWLGAFTPSGRYLAFNTSTPNVTPGDSDLAIDGYLHDLWTGVVRRVTLR